MFIGVYWSVVVYILLYIGVYCFVVQCSVLNGVVACSDGVQWRVVDVV